jgi:thiol-disulfide isomerase/thioredoxin
MRLPWLTKRRQFLAAGGLAVIGVAYAAKRVFGIQLRKPPLVGERVPAMTLEFVSNAQGAFELPPGKVTLLDFFESSCGPCRAALPKAQHRVPDVAFVAVCIDDERETAEKVAKEWGLVKPVAWDTRGDARKAFRIVGIPNLVVVSPSGLVTGWFPYDPPDAVLSDAIDEAREDERG